MLNKIKLALRISHNYLDSEISALIDTARAELIRSGVSESASLSEEDPLIVQAIKCYVLSVMSGDQKVCDNYEKAWLYQLENIRKSKGYRGGDQ